MATMFPQNFDDFATPGEAAVYHFLQTALRPDSACLAWYTPSLEGAEPDFIIYTPDTGLIVFEVKDWLADQIVDMDQHQVVLLINGDKVARKHPVPQVKNYAHKLMAMLNKYTNQSINYKRQLPCPVSWGVIFPHMTRDELARVGMPQFTEGTVVLCLDDISETSTFVRDKSGQSLRQYMKENRHEKAKFDFALAPDKLAWIQSCIYPVVHLPKPRRRNAANEEQEQIILRLDHKLEVLSGGLAPGRMLFTGPAGTGKTLVLAHLAQALPEANKAIRKILFVCFNLSLVGYIRRLLSRKAIGLGEAQVSVLPFFDVCERILGEDLEHARESREYYEVVVKECLDRVGPDHPLNGNWDAILVDEGQDFTEDMARVLLGLLPEKGQLAVAQDDSQSIYQATPSPWKHLCPDLREHRLQWQYRSTKAINAFAGRLLDKPAARLFQCGASGLAPSWCVAAEWSALIERTADAIAALVQDAIAMNEIAVLYTRANVPGDIHLPTALVAALEARGVLARWSAENEYSKRTYDITTDCVTVSTVHSVKGLDFAHVFLLGLDLLPEDTVQNRHLAYVGMTRARETLTLGICDAACWVRGVCGEDIGQSGTLG